MMLIDDLIEDFCRSELTNTENEKYAVMVAMNQEN